MSRSDGVDQIQPAEYPLQLLPNAERRKEVIEHSLVIDLPPDLAHGVERPTQIARQ